MSTKRSNASKSRSSQEAPSKKAKRAPASASSSAAPLDSSANAHADMEIDSTVERKTRSSSQEQERAAIHNDLIDSAIASRNVELSLNDLEVLPLRAVRASGVAFLVEEIKKKGWLGSLSPLYVQRIHGSSKFRVIEGNHRYVTALNSEKILIYCI